MWLWLGYGECGYGWGMVIAVWVGYGDSGMGMVNVIELVMVVMVRVR